MCVACLGWFALLEALPLSSNYTFQPSLFPRTKRLPTRLLKGSALSCRDGGSWYWSHLVTARKEMLQRNKGKRQDLPDGLLNVDQLPFSCRFISWGMWKLGCWEVTELVPPQSQPPWRPTSSSAPKPSVLWSGPFPAPRIFAWHSYSLSPSMSGPHLLSIYQGPSFSRIPPRLLWSTYTAPLSMHTCVPYRSFQHLIMGRLEGFDLFSVHFYSYNWEAALSRAWIISRQILFKLMKTVYRTFPEELFACTVSRQSCTFWGLSSCLLLLWNSQGI